jgi:Uma2 family endonuclease
MAEVAPPPPPLSIDEMDWPEIELPPTDLPYDDGDKMETSWHADAQYVLKASVIAVHGGNRDDYYVANNMFVYYSLDQVRNKEYRGPDVFVVKHVDGNRYRDSWIAWAEGGRLPDVIFELLSTTTEQADLGKKKQLYEQVFRTAEYFCIGYAVDRLLGWRLMGGVYVPIAPDAHGRLWSETLGVAIGPWRGPIFTQDHTWPRFYTAEGDLILLHDEAAQAQADAAQAQAEAAQAQAEAAQAQAEAAQAQAETAQAQAEAAQAQAETERRRADDLAVRLAAVEVELKRLRGETP